MSLNWPFQAITAQKLGFKSNSRKPQIVDGKRVTTYMNAMMYQIDIFTCQGCFTDFESKESVDGHYHLCPGAVKDSKVGVMTLSWYFDLMASVLGERNKKKLWDGKKWNNYVDKVS